MESYHSSTYLIVIGFIIITLAMGLYGGRGIKTIEDYALGGKSFSTFSLVLTFIATVVGGGSVIGATSNTFNIGLIGRVPVLASFFQILMFALILAPRIAKFQKSLTTGDIMKVLYGPKAKVLTGVLGSLFTLCITAMQLSVLGKLLQHTLGVDFTIGVVSSGLILGLYSSFGGIKAVTITDVFQFLVLYIAIPLVSVKALSMVGGYKVLLQSLPSEKLQIFSHPNFYHYATLFMMWTVFPTMLTDPPVVQRILMNSSPKQAKSQFLGILSVHPILSIVIAIMGLSTILLFPGSPGDGIIYKLIDLVIQNPVLKGVVFSGLIAVVMSTADSYMHSAGITFAHDVLKPINDHYKKSVNEVLYARISTMVIVLISILIALKSSYFVNLNYWAMKTSGPLLFAPLLLGVLGVKPNNKSFIAGMISGGVSFLIYNHTLSSNMKMLAIPFSMISNGIVYLIWHIIQNKGLAWVEHESTQNKGGVWTPSLERTLNFITSYIPSPHKLLSYSKSSVMKYGANNMLFGVFVCVNFTLPYFLWYHQDTEISSFLTNLRFIGGILAGLLIVRSEWKTLFKPHFHILWHLTLCYCLPFITTLMVLLSNGSIEWMVNVAVSIFFLILLTSGGMFLILLPSGIAAGLLTHKIVFGSVNFSSYGFEFNYNLFYVFFFSTVIALLFAYRKRLFYLIRGNQGMNLGGALAHELKNCGFQALPTAQLVSKYATLRTESIQHNGKMGVFMEEEVFDNVVKYADQTAYHMKQTIDITKGFEKIFEEFKDSIANPMVISARAVVEKAYNEFVFVDEAQKRGVELKLKNDFYAKIPKEAFTYVITNIIRNSYIHGKATKLQIWLDSHKIHIRDNGIGITPEHLPNNIFDLYYTTGDTETTGRGLAFCKQIVDSSYGKISVDTQSEGNDTFTEIIITLPSVSASEIDELNLKDCENEGLSKGKDIAKKYIADSMLRDGKDVDEIIKYTGLSRLEIQELKRGI